MKMIQKIFKAGSKWLHPASPEKHQQLDLPSSARDQSKRE